VLPSRGGGTRRGTLVPRRFRAEPYRTLVPAPLPRRALPHPRPAPLPRRALPHPRPGAASAPRWPSSAVSRPTSPTPRAPAV